MTDIQSADPTARKRAALCILGAVIVAAVTVAAIRLYAPDWQVFIENNPQVIIDHPWRIAAGSAVAIVPLPIVALFILATARRILASGRFPPPGAPVVKDTPILNGRRAVTRARLLQTLAVMLIVVSITVPVVVWKIVVSLQGAG